MIYTDDCRVCLKSFCCKKHRDNHENETHENYLPYLQNLPQICIKCNTLVRTIHHLQNNCVKLFHKQLHVPCASAENSNKSKGTTCRKRTYKSINASNHFPMSIPDLSSPNKRIRKQAKIRNKEKKVIAKNMDGKACSQEEDCGDTSPKFEEVKVSSTPILRDEQNLRIQLLKSKLELSCKQTPIKNFDLNHTPKKRVQKTGNANEEEHNLTYNSFHPKTPENVSNISFYETPIDIFLPSSMKELTFFSNEFNSQNSVEYSIYGTPSSSEVSVKGTSFQNINHFPPSDSALKASKFGFATDFEMESHDNFESSPTKSAVTSHNIKSLVSVLPKRTKITPVSLNIESDSSPFFSVEINSGIENANILVPSGNTPESSSINAGIISGTKDVKKVRNVLEELFDDGKLKIVDQTYDEKDSKKSTVKKSILFSEDYATLNFHEHPLCGEKEISENRSNYILNGGNEQPKNFNDCMPLTNVPVCIHKNLYLSNNIKNENSVESPNNNSSELGSRFSQLSNDIPSIILSCSDAPTNKLGKVSDENCDPAKIDRPSSRICISENLKLKNSTVANSSSDARKLILQELPASLFSESTSLCLIKTEDINFMLKPRNKEVFNDLTSLIMNHPSLNEGDNVYPSKIESTGASQTIFKSDSNDTTNCSLGTEDCVPPKSSNAKLNLHLSLSDTQIDTKKRNETDQIKRKCDKSSMTTFKSDSNVLNEEFCAPSKVLDQSFSSISTSENENNITVKLMASLSSKKCIALTACSNLSSTLNCQKIKNSIECLHSIENIKETFLCPTCFEDLENIDFMNIKEAFNKRSESQISESKFEYIKAKNKENFQDNSNKAFYCCEENKSFTERIFPTDNNCGSNSQLAVEKSFNQASKNLPNISSVTSQKFSDLNSKNAETTAEKSLTENRPNNLLNHEMNGEILMERQFEEKSEEYIEIHQESVNYNPYKILLEDNVDFNPEPSVNLNENSQLNQDETIVFKTLNFKANNEVSSFNFNESVESINVSTSEIFTVLNNPPIFKKKEETAFSELKRRRIRNEVINSDITKLQFLIENEQKTVDNHSEIEDVLEDATTLNRCRTNSTFSSVNCGHHRTVNIISKYIAKDASQISLSDVTHQNDMNYPIESSCSSKASLQCDKKKSKNPSQHDAESSEKLSKNKTRCPSMNSLEEDPHLTSRSEPKKLFENFSEVGTFVIPMQGKSYDCSVSVTSEPEESNSNFKTLEGSRHNLQKTCDSIPTLDKSDIDPGKFEANKCKLHRTGLKIDGQVENSHEQFPVQTPPISSSSTTILVSKRKCNKRLERKTDTYFFANNESSKKTCKANSGTILDLEFINSSQTSECVSVRENIAQATAQNKSPVLKDDNRETIALKIDKNPHNVSTTNDKFEENVAPIYSYGNISVSPNFSSFNIDNTRNNYLFSGQSISPSLDPTSNGNENYGDRFLRFNSSFITNLNTTAHKNPSELPFNAVEFHSTPIVHPSSKLSTSLDEESLFYSRTDNDDAPSSSRNDKGFFGFARKRFRSYLPNFFMSRKSCKSSTNRKGIVEESNSLVSIDLSPSKFSQEQKESDNTAPIVTVRAQKDLLRKIHAPSWPRHRQPIRNKRALNIPDSSEFKHKDSSNVNDIISPLRNTYRANFHLLSLRIMSSWPKARQTIRKRRVEENTLNFSGITSPNQDNQP